MTAGQLWAGVDVGKEPALQNDATEGFCRPVQPQLRPQGERWS